VSSLPRRTKVLQSVWAMRHKCQIATSKIHKWKGCLNIHCGQQVEDVPSTLLNEGGSSTTEGATRATQFVEARTVDPMTNVPSTNEGDSSNTEGATRAMSPTSAVQVTAPPLPHPLPWEPLVEDLLPPKRRCFLNFESLKKNFSSKHYGYFNGVSHV